MPTFFHNPELLEQKRHLLNDSKKILEPALHLKISLEKQVEDIQKKRGEAIAQEKANIEQGYENDLNMISSMNQESYADLKSVLDEKKQERLSNLDKKEAQEQAKEEGLKRTYNRKWDILRNDWRSINRGTKGNTSVDIYSYGLRRYLCVDHYFDINPICKFLEENQYIIDNKLELDLNTLKNNNALFLNEKIEHQKALQKILQYQLYLELVGAAIAGLAPFLLIPLAIPVLPILAFLVISVCTLGIITWIMAYTAAQQGMTVMELLMTQSCNAYLGNTCVGLLLLSSFISLIVGTSLLHIASAVDSKPAFDDNHPFMLKTAPQQEEKEKPNPETPELSETNALRS